MRLGRGEDEVSQCQDRMRMLSDISEFEVNRFLLTTLLRSTHTRSMQRSCQPPKNKYFLSWTYIFIPRVSLTLVLLASWLFSFASGRLVLLLFACSSVEVLHIPVFYYSDFLPAFLICTSGLAITSLFACKEGIGFYTCSLGSEQLFVGASAMPGSEGTISVFCFQIPFLLSLLSRLFVVSAWSSLFCCLHFTFWAHLSCFLVSCFHTLVTEKRKRKPTYCRVIVLSSPFHRPGSAEGERGPSEKKPRFIRPFFFSLVNNFYLLFLEAFCLVPFEARWVVLPLLPLLIRHGVFELALVMFGWALVCSELINVYILHHDRHQQLSFSEIP